MYHNVEKAHKKGASVSTMNEATHKETNTNPENPEKTTWTLEEAETKLKEELKKFQDAGEDILNQYENIANIQKEIDETKQIIESLQSNKKKKVDPKYDCSSPQTIFKEFRKIYRDKYKKDTRKYKKTRDDFFSPIQLLIIIFLISYILSAFFADILNSFGLAISIIYMILYIVFVIIVLLRSLKIIDEKYMKKLDIIMLGFTAAYAIYFITYGLLNNSYIALEALGFHSKIYLAVIVGLLFILSCIDNVYKNYSEKEKENAVLAIEELLGKEVSDELLKKLIKFQDEIGDEFINEFESSFIYKFIIFLGGGSFILNIPNILNITKIETEFLLYIKLLVFVVVLFFLHRACLHEKKLYLEILKDMEFKEALEISKKGR